jgi:hypothetical protein
MGTGLDRCKCTNQPADLLRWSNMRQQSLGGLLPYRMLGAKRLYQDLKLTAACIDRIEEPRIDQRLRT